MCRGQSGIVAAVTRGRRRRRKRWWWWCERCKSAVVWLLAALVSVSVSLGWLGVGQGMALALSEWSPVTYDARVGEGGDSAAAVVGRAGIYAFYCCRRQSVLCSIAAG